MPLKLGFTFCIYTLPWAFCSDLWLSVLSTHWWLANVHLQPSFSPELQANIISNLVNDSTWMFTNTSNLSCPKWDARFFLQRPAPLKFFLSGLKATPFFQLLKPNFSLTSMLNLARVFVVSVFRISPLLTSINATPHPEPESSHHWHLSACFLFPSSFFLKFLQITLAINPNGNNPYLKIMYSIFQFCFQREKNVF